MLAELQLTFTNKEVHRKAELKLINYTLDEIAKDI